MRKGAYHKLNYQSLNLLDTEFIRSGVYHILAYQILNLWDTELIRYQTFQRLDLKIVNWSDTRLVRYLIGKITNLSYNKLIRFRIYQIQNFQVSTAFSNILPDTRHVSILFGGALIYCYWTQNHHRFKWMITAGGPNFATGCLEGCMGHDWRLDASARMVRGGGGVVYWWEGTMGGANFVQIHGVQPHKCRYKIMCTYTRSHIHVHPQSRLHMWILGHHTRLNIKSFAFLIQIRFEVIPHYGLYRETDPRWNQLHTALWPIAQNHIMNLWPSARIQNLRCGPL
jgi:hypothetical protein